MKKILIVLLLLLVFAKPAFAQSPSLSDEVYADLALRGDLNNVSISFSDGKNFDSIGINDTKHWLPASTVKLFAAMYAFQKISNHQLNLSDTVVAEAKNVVPTESVDNGLPTIQVGDTLSIQRLITEMLTQSDNTAFNILLDTLDRREVTKYIQSIGLSHSAVGSKLNLDTSQTQFEFDAGGYGINTTTSADYALAFNLIFNNKIPGAKELLDILKQQKINYMIPLLLPKGTVVAHKHGDLDPLYHDGGIVYAKNGPYIVSIFSNAGDPNLVAHLSELIYSRDPKLVGTSVQNLTPLSYVNPPIDPIVAEGTLTNTQVLGAQSPEIQTQPITAADLGITSEDLSLKKSIPQLPKVVIPADAPFNSLVMIGQLIKKIAALDPKTRAKVDQETMLLQIAEVKDLYQRGKTAMANDLVQTVQTEIKNTAVSETTKNDAATQIALQAVSETRFEVLGASLKDTSGAKRDELIHEIAQQAKDTVTQVAPNLPLAANATNVTQKPLIGEVVSKNDNAVVVQTAGGQEITIPTDNQNVTVKEKSVPETNNEVTVTPTQPQKPSLANVAVGTTVAIVGSSVGNTFTPTFVLTNVPRELAAPEPVTVIKVNNENKTMVISENGIPVQVNVNSKTAIRGTDTDINLNQIKPGDVVVVHGQPLTPIVKPEPILTPATNQPAPSGGKTNPGSSAPNGVNTTGSPQGTSTQIIPTTSQKNQSGTTTQGTSGTNSVGGTSSNQTAPVQGSSKTSQTSAPSTVKPQTSAPATIKTSAPAASAPAPAQAAPQPKVIQSTSIQVIQKKEDAASKPEQHSAPPPAAPQQQQSEQHSAPPPASNNNPPPQQQQPAQTQQTQDQGKHDDKKK